MKNVLITGASSGIGKALAKTLDTGNYRLLLSGRNEDRLNSLASELNCEHEVMVADVTSIEDCQALVRKCVDRWTELHVLVNNAGLGYFDPIDQGNLAQWHNMIDINMKGVLNLIHAALPPLKESQGHVINLGSIASHHVFPNSGVYCATKHAVLAISESLRIELNGQVRVTTISPGAVDTDFINKTTNDELREGMKDYFASSMRPTTVAQQIKHVIEAPEDAVIHEIILRPFR